MSWWWGAYREFYKNVPRVLLWVSILKTVYTEYSWSLCYSRVKQGLWIDLNLLVWSYLLLSVISKLYLFCRRVSRRPPRGHGRVDVGAVLDQPPRSLNLSVEFMLIISLILILLISSLPVCSPPPSSAPSTRAPFWSSRRLASRSHSESGKFRVVQ